VSEREETEETKAGKRQSTNGAINRKWWSENARRERSVVATLMHCLFPGSVSFLYFFTVKTILIIASALLDW